jgi:type II restriction enzyme
MSEQFNTFMSQLSESNATLDYFTDFEKIKNNIAKISIKLNQLNYLIGKDDLYTAIKELFEENSKVFEVLDILIAVRKNKNAKTFNRDGEIVLLDSYFTSPEKLFEFIEETGLGDIFRNKNITNLVDYVFGVEVGLDTNARKNRGGENMSKAVSLLFDNANVFYKKEVNSSEFIDITSLGADLKRFDFVIKTRTKTYLIETNFYNGGGSKLNEVARAYSEVAPKINKYPNYEFVWITDGQGWKSAKNKLEQAFSIIPSVYNLTTLDNFINKIISEQVITF